MKKIQKGNFGYIDHQKKKEILRTFCYFFISLSLYLIGYGVTKSNKNIMTVIAVLGCLPASKSAVSMILFLRSTGCPKDAYEAIHPHEQERCVLYDLVFTSYQKNYKIASLLVTPNTICGYTADPSCDLEGVQKHLKTYLSQNGYHDISIIIFREIKKYTERMDNLGQISLPVAGKVPGIDQEKEAGMASVLLSISI